MLYKLADLLKTSPKDLIAKTVQAAGEIKALRHELEALQEKIAQKDAQGMLQYAKDISGLKVITAQLGDVKGDALRVIGSQLRDMDENVVAVLASIADGKIVFNASCGKSAVARGVKAGDLVRTVAKVAGGNGGGKPDSAMAGGNDPLKLDDALAVVDDFVAEHAK